MARQFQAQRGSYKRSIEVSLLGALHSVELKENVISIAFSPICRNDIEVQCDVWDE
jgi:hypothetical protein